MNGLQQQCAALCGRLAGWARRAAAAVLAAGPVPRHVAFIMDGNRRYAEARRLRQVEGHAYGYARLLGALEWCLELGVTCVSVYAFSIDNYRRSAEEVATLMALAHEKLAALLQECAALERHGVAVRVIGDLSLAPPEVQAAAAAVEEATRHHDRAVLNLCFSYTASEEMLRALDGLAAAQHASGSGTGSSSPSSGDARAELERRLYTGGCPPVDLLVRTSGETRLSDFLLWQSRHALLVFTRVLWPQFGFLDLVAAVLQYQRQYPHLHRLRARADSQAAAAAAAAAEADARLPPLKLAAEQQRRRGSPCSIASPASPSSRSSRSEGSEEAAAAAAAGAKAAAVERALAAPRGAAGEALLRAAAA